MKRIKVTRAFLLAGERQEVGKVVEVSDGLAAELIHGDKAAPAGDKPVGKRGPMTTVSAPALAGKVEPEKE